MLRWLCFFLVTFALPKRTPAQSFEIAAVKPANADTAGSRIDLENGNQFIARNVSVRSLVKVAYHLTFNADDQVICSSPWFSAKTFDIDAKLDEASVRALATLDPTTRFDRVRLMLQALLKDRFQLSLHHETREKTVDALVAAKSGLRLHEATQTPTPWTGLKVLAPGRIEGHKATIDNLANALVQQPEVGGRLVTNGTGVEGEYDFTLLWASEALHGATPPADIDLFTALREQLGLRILTTKIPVDVLVVDEVQLPAAN